ncbi:hypothetical protein FLP08_06645 [Gramella aestuarii]|uniref:Multidrug transporter n=2 Tax=Christiangramia aestuarii TaxID=1028746 RepID=A0A7K1LN61_9FLAO|nr:hypothetical protein [Christiangramia aestuarii]
MKKIKFSLTVLVFAAIMTGCSSDDDLNVTPTASCSDGIQNGTETGVDCGGSCTPCENQAQKDGVIDSQDDPDLDPADLKGDVTADITLDANTAWTLTGSLTVKAGATLTIDPGTTIMAQPGGTNVYIAIEQDALIDAEGTADEPIVITSAATNKRSGDWGGLILAGKAPINSGTTAEAEVVGLTYGGTEADDSSGTLKYVKVEYTGARIGGEQEFNGITFYGVGSGTVIENIAVLNGDDDGIEWFGGTVSVKNALVVNAKDDWFDWTEGWAGKGNTNFFGVREFGYNDVTEDPRGIEADSNSSNNDASPRSNPTIDGLTLLHQSQIEMADMIKIRRGSSATITNGVIAILAAEGEDPGSASDFIDLTDGSGAAAATTSINVSAVGAADGSDVKNEVGATITVVDGNTGADASLFGWTGYTIPTIE